MADNEPTLTFHWADYLVFGCFLVFSTLLGVIIGYRNRKKATSAEFLMGGGDMHWIPVALSMQASFLSAIYILTTPTEIYSFGTMYTYIAVSYFIALPVAAHMYLPIFYRLKLVSAYGYLEMRFNRSVRIAGSITFCLMVLLYMSVVLYTPAIALAQVTGLPIYFSIPLCGIVCVIYTFLGGMKATIWNDFCQMIVITAGLIVIIVFGLIEIGGFGPMWDINVNGGRIKFDEFHVDPTIRTTFWTQSVGGTFVSITLYASSQTIIQKFLSVKNLRNAQKSLYLAAVTSTIFLVLVTIIGLIMYAYYEKCDPVLSGKVDKADQMVPLFVMEILGPMPGLPGLFIATTFSAALSSVSGSLTALSAVTLYDFIRPAYLKSKGHELNEKTCAILSRVLTLVFGVFTICMGFIAQFLGDFVLQIALSVFGFLGGPVMALLTLGIFIPFINSWGALAGIISSLLICSWIAIGTIVAKPPVCLLDRSIEGCSISTMDPNMTTSLMPDLTSMFLSSTVTSPCDPGGASDVLWIYKISYMYYSLIALSVAIIVAVPISLLTGRTKRLNKNLLYDWGSHCCCYCPSPCRTCLHCGVINEDIDDESEELKVSPMYFDPTLDDVTKLNNNKDGGGGSYENKDGVKGGYDNMGVVGDIEVPPTSTFTSVVPESLETEPDVPGAPEIEPDPPIDYYNYYYNEHL